MFRNLICVNQLRYSRLILCGLVLVLLSACSHAIQPWVKLESTQELKQLKIDNYMLKQELSIYRKKLMQANLESRKLAGQLQRGGHLPAKNSAQAMQRKTQTTPRSAMQGTRMLQSSGMSSAPKETALPKAVAKKKATPKSKQPAQKWTMKMRLFFDSGHKDTSPAMRRQLAAFVKTLPPDVKVRVAGHSDNEPVSSAKNGGGTSSSAPDDNKAASKERAMAVVRALTEVGLSSKRMQVGSFGASRPLASNDSAAGRAKNRRVEIFINETAHVNNPARQEKLAPNLHAVKQTPAVVKTVSPPRPAVKPTAKVRNTAPSIAQPAPKKARTAQETKQKTATDKNWSTKMRLFFNKGQRWTSPTMRKQLRAFANSLPPMARIRIAGHSDNLRILQPKASLENNKAMSIERARSVFRGLRAYGVKPERMQVEGFGATQPLASNDTTEGRAKNRRVEILINE